MQLLNPFDNMDSTKGEQQKMKTDVALSSLKASAFWNEQAPTHMEQKFIDFAREEAANSDRYQAWIAEFEIPYPPPPVGGWFFFYGSLMDPTRLQQVLQLSYTPKLLSASIYGGSSGHRIQFREMRLGQWPAVVRYRNEPTHIEWDETIRGMAFFVQSRAPVMQRRIDNYESKAYRSQNVDIHFLGDWQKYIPDYPVGRLEQGVKGTAYFWHDTDNLTELSENKLAHNAWQLSEEYHVEVAKIGESKL